jgi:hypothetical protein
MMEEFYFVIHKRPKQVYAVKADGDNHTRHCTVPRHRRARARARGGGGGAVSVETAFKMTADCASGMHVTYRSAITSERVYKFHFTDLQDVFSS